MSGYQPTKSNKATSQQRESQSRTSSNGKRLSESEWDEEIGELKQSKLKAGDEEKAAEEATRGKTEIAVLYLLNSISLHGHSRKQTYVFNGEAAGEQLVGKFRCFKVPAERVIRIVKTEKQRLYEAKAPKHKHAGFMPDLREYPYELVKGWVLKL